MTAWKTIFTREELEDWKTSVTDSDLKDRIEIMLDCLGMCRSNNILVTIEQQKGIG